MLTNTQLLLSIGIPTLTVIVAMFNNNSRSERLEKRLDAIEARFDEIKESNHKDALEIMRQMTALHERVAVVEAKQAK